MPFSTPADEFLALNGLYSFILMLGFGLKAEVCCTETY